MSLIRRMKLIGVTGTIGKTSVCEIVYQYLLFIGKKVSLYSSNGLFVNNTTRCKDYFKTTLDKATLDKFLELDEEDGIEYVIIEITGESVKRGDKIEAYPYEVVALTSFYVNRFWNYDSKEEYLECKRKILGNQKKVLLRYGDPKKFISINYDLFKDIPHKTCGYDEVCDYQTTILENSIQGLSLKFQGVSFKTNLITGFNATNLSIVMALLSEIGELDMRTFSLFATNIKVRGRFEKMMVNNKMVILDTGLAGLEIALSGIEDSLKSKNYKVVYTNLADDGTQRMKSRRNYAGLQLANAKYVYLTSFKENENELKVFTDEVIQGKNIRFEYIMEPKDAVRKAINNLNDDEVLVIITRERYRKYKRILEEIQMGGKK